MTIRVLLTGGTGYLGIEVISELARRAIEVHVLARNPPASEAHTNVVWHRNDLMGEIPSNLIASLRPTHCLHLAWEAVPGRYRQARENYDWAAATIRLARAFFDSGGQHFSLAGSCAEYALPTPICDEAKTPLSANCAYSLCKVEAARLVTALAGDCGAKFANPRIFYVYGPAEPQNKLVGSICRSLLTGRPIPLTSGADIVDYVYRSDVVNALVAIVLSGASGVINIGSGTATRVRDIALRLGEIAGRPELLQFDQLPLGREPVRILANIERLVSDVGYTPLVTLDQGLRICYSTWKESLFPRSAAPVNSTSMRVSGG